MLFKYAREKYRERQALTTNDTQLTSDITPGQEQKPLTFQKTDVQGQGSPTPQKVDGKHASIADLEQHQTSPSSEYDARVRLEASRRRKYRWKMIGGLLLPNFLAAVDAFIVAPAVPTISSHFSKFHIVPPSQPNLTRQDRLSGAFNWIVAAYTLAFTTFVPCSGQIADIYGRHTALQFHMFFILIGSVFAAAAATWPMVLFGRALQGLGAAGIYNLTRIILSDNATLADNSKNNTIFSLINGIRYVGNFKNIGSYCTALRRFER